MCITSMVSEFVSILIRCSRCKRVIQSVIKGMKYSHCIPLSSSILVVVFNQKQVCSVILIFCSCNSGFILFSTDLFSWHIAFSFCSYFNGSLLKATEHKRWKGASKLFIYGKINLPINDHYVTSCQKSYCFDILVFYMFTILYYNDVGSYFRYCLFTCSNCFCSYLSKEKIAQLLYGVGVL